MNFYKKNICQEHHIRVSNSLDPDQARRFVEPNLGPNCLQKLSADDKSRVKIVPLIIPLLGSTTDGLSYVFFFFPVYWVVSGKQCVDGASHIFFHFCHLFFQTATPVIFGSLR